MYYNLTENNSDRILPNTETKKKTFNFSTLSRVDDFWMHLIFLFLQNSKRKQIYQWLPHPWFNLINSHKSYPLQQALSSVSYSVKNIVGGDTFLDLNANKISTVGAYEYSYAEGPFNSLQDIYYSCSDTYLFIIKISKERALEIENLYQSCSSLDNLGMKQVDDAINKPSVIKTTIEHKTKKQTKIWKEFCKFFEI